MKNSNKKKFVILVDLGHRVARVISYAENYIIALFKVFKRYENKQPHFSSYSPIIM